MDTIPLYSRRRIVSSCRVDPDIAWMTQEYNLQWYENSDPNRSPRISFGINMDGTDTTWHLLLSRVVYLAKQGEFIYNEQLLNSHPFFEALIRYDVKTRLYIATKSLPYTIMTNGPSDCRRVSIETKKNTRLRVIERFDVNRALPRDLRKLSYADETMETSNFNNSPALPLDSLENDTELMSQLQQLTQKYETDEKIKSINTINIGDMNSTEDSIDIAFDLMFMKQNQIDTIEALHSVYLKMPHIKRKYDEEKSKYETEIETV